MKHINIISLTQAFDTLEKEEYLKLLAYHDIEIKDAEVNDLIFIGGSTFIVAEAL